MNSHGRVITDDLMLLENASLRELAGKGQKYKEPNKAVGTLRRQ